MPSARSVKLYQLLNYGFNLYIVGLTIFWIIWLGRDLLQKNIPFWPLACFSALSLLLCLLAKPILDTLVVGRGVNIGGAPLGLAFLFSGGGLLVAAGYWASMKRVMQANVTLLVFLLFGPALFLFYIVQWWSGIDRVPDWSFGDDWSRYQTFAFRIAAWGDILSGGGEPIFYYQPFYRYIVAFFHWIFGKSVVAQQLFDVWCVLGAAMILAAFVRRYAVSAQNAFLASILFLVPVLMSPLRHHIGRGLAEYSGMIFLLLALWLLARNESKNWSQIMLAGIVAVLGYWVRQDHILILAALVFLLIEPVSGTTSGVWSTYKVRIGQEWKAISMYLLILGCGVLAILLRHWLLADQFVLSIPGHENYVFFRHYENESPIPFQWQPIYFIRKLQLILAMKPVGEFPSPFAVGMMLGTLFALLALVWRPHVLQKVPLSIGLMLLAAFLPYYFSRIPSYPPRFSIHVLPIATMALIFVWDRWLKLIGQQQRFPIVVKCSRLFGGVPSNSD